MLPTVGSKELVALLPTLLGLGAGDTVVVPEVAYPTYDVGARVAGCEIVVADSTHALGPQRVSPGVDQLAVATRPVACCLWSTSPRWSRGRASAARSW